MAQVLRMPEVAANATEAVLSEWLVPENTTFAARDAIATVETEKAAVEVEAETDGVVLKKLIPPGARVEVGAPIAVVGAPGEAIDDLGALLARLGVVEQSGHVVPEGRDVFDAAPGASSRSTASDISRAPAPDPEGGTAQTHPSAPSAMRRDGAPERRPPDARRPRPRLGRAANDADRVFASPLARRMAREAGLALEALDGTGPRSRILRRDVERALAARPARLESAATATSTADAPTVEPRRAPYTEVAHSRIRRATAARLVQSKTTAPHFYLRATLRVHRMVDLRAELNAGLESPISLNDLVLKAAAAAHDAVPEMNVVWTPDAVRAYEQVDLAIAVATERGLLSPVVRDVSGRSVTAVAADVRGLVERARARRLRQEELEGGTMTVTNLGMFGTEEFAAIINPPHTSILAVGAVREEPVVDDGALAVGKVMRVTLSVDHRPVDGVVAARWMQAFTDLVEHPVRMLA